MIPPVSPSVSPDPLVGLRGREPSVDEVLGLKSSGSADLLRPESAQGRPFPESDPVRGLDPLEFLGSAARSIPPPTVPDHGQEVFTPYVPPVAKADPARQIPWEAAPPPVQPGVPLPPPPPIPGDVAGAPVATPGHAALFRAFLGGAGIPEAHLPAGLTPETMEGIGKLLREAVQGTLDLLRVRGIMKSEMRADVTMIMPLDNNPLKFSPTVEAALVHLLAPHMRGFVPPLRAMREAYDDLRAHQLAFLAGMRAALEEVLARFEPEQLQKRLSDPTVLDSLLPMNRKAKRWDLFVERYEEVAGDAREDFNAAFGTAFRRAYEAQVKQLRAEGR